MRILITGIHGFVGSNLVEALKANHTIYGLDIIAPEKDGVKRTYSWSDLENGVIPEVDAIILRPCMIHGPGNKGNLNLLYGVISKGIPWPLGAFENRRTFTSIGNLSFIIDKLLSTTVESGIYNMADDTSLSTNELIEVMCSAMDRKSHIWNLPKGLIRFGAKVGDVLNLPLNTFRLDKLTENYVVSNVKLKKALGIESMPVNAKDGLIQTIRSFQNK